MRLLFVHQNFPGQYRHLAAHYARQPGNQVAAIGEARHLRPFPGVKLFGYRNEQPEGENAFEDPVVKAIRRGRNVARGAAQLARAGWVPDVVFTHIGWGEALFLKDVFPAAKVLLYSEFFYRARGADLGFDPEFPASADKVLRLRVMNAPLLMSLDASDAGMAPTRWQQRQFPAVYASRLNVIHDGVDTDLVAPSNSVEKEELVTYAARNLEPYRGFHSFMRALPEIQKRRPNARIVIVGGDEVSYSPRLPAGETYRARMLRELEGKINTEKIQFTGRIGYADYLRILQRSSVHVYLTYPFVLSWSLLEAMAAGCLVVGSRTPPVEEVIRDGENGLLTDFFSSEGIADRVDYALSHRQELQPLREKARQTVVERYDLKRVCLPAQVNLVEKVLAAGRPAALHATQYASRPRRLAR